MSNKLDIKLGQAISSELLNWMEAFLIDRRTTGLSKKTIAFYREGLTSFFKFCAGLAVEEIENITPNVIRQYLLFLENTNHNPGGIHAKYRTLRVFLNWYEVEIDDPEYRNPIRKIRVRLSKIQPLDPADIGAVREMLKSCEERSNDPQWKKRRDFMNLRDKVIILMLLDTGLRASELLSLMTDNVNTITGVVQVVQGKGGKSRVVYISRKTRQVLRKYLKAVDIQNHIFIGICGYPITRNGLHQILARRAEWAGVEKQPPHSFRRLFALTMLRNGVDIYSLQLLMGHADLQVLKRYLKLTQQDSLRAHIKGSPVEKLL